MLETPGSATKWSSSKDPNQHFPPKVIRLRSAIDPKPECASGPSPYLRCTLSIVSGRPRTPAPQPASTLTGWASTLLPLQYGDAVSGTPSFPCLRPLRPPKTQRLKPPDRGRAQALLCRTSASCWSGEVARQDFRPGFVSHLETVFEEGTPRHSQASAAEALMRVRVWGLVLDGPAFVSMITRN